MRRSGACSDRRVIWPDGDPEPSTVCGSLAGRSKEYQYSIKPRLPLKTISSMAWALFCCNNDIEKVS
jgi:hypothetical protein